MNLKLFGPGATVRVGDTFNLVVACDNPGIVNLVYGPGLTGSATANIAGTRVYGNMGVEGDFLAILDVGQTRDNVTFFFTINFADKIQGWTTTPAASMAGRPLFYNGKRTGTNRVNWLITYYNFSGNQYIYYVHSLTSINNAVAAVVHTCTGETGVVKFAIVKDNTAGTVAIYRNNRSEVVVSAATHTTTDTMGSPEIMMFYHGLNLSKINRIATDLELDDWFASDLIPTTDLDFSYLGGHEIIEATPKIWDASSNERDLYKYDFVGRPSKMHADFTDTIPVTPYAIVPVTAISTTGCTVDATRARQGVPSRASYAERVEVADQLNLTVLAALPNEQYTAQLLIYSDVAATALITMDNPIINFPASVVVAAGKNQISGLITGDGVCNVTVNINGVTDVTTFTIDRIAALLSMGPDIDQGVESFPAALKMHVYSNSDDSIDLVSDNAEIIVSSPVLITNGVAEVDVTINEETTGTITATNDLGMTAVAAVDVYYNPLLLKIGPPQTVLRGDADLTIYLIVVSDTPGTVALASSDINLEVPASVVIGDDLFAVIECVAVGGCVATVTATKGIRVGSCVLTVNQSAESSPVPTKGTSHNLPTGEDYDGRNINRISLPNMEVVDWSVFDWLKTMDVSVEGSPELGGFKQVPVIWVGTERSFQSKVYKELRDISGSLNPPYITVSRKGVKKDLNKKGQHWANVPAVYDYLQGVLPIRREIRHDKTAQFMNNNAKRRTGKSSYKFDEVPTDTKPVYEVTYVPIPVYLTFTYEIKIWTSYRSQMNTIEQKLLTYVPAGNINRFVLSHDGHYFEGFLGEDVVEEGNVDAIEKEERKFETTFTLEVLGHVAGEEQNQNSPYAAKRETFAETAVDIELGD